MLAKLLQLGEGRGVADVDPEPLECLADPDTKGGLALRAYRERESKGTSVVKRVSAKPNVEWRGLLLRSLAYAS